MTKPLKILLWIVVTGFIAFSCYVTATAQDVVSRRSVTAPAGDIAVDDSSKGEQTSGATYTQAHTCTGAGILFVGVASWKDGGGQSMEAEYNGDAMTSIGVKTDEGDEIEVFYRLNPDEGTHNIVVTPSSSDCEIAVAAMSLKTVAALTGGTSANGSDNSYEMTITSAAGSWAVAFLSTYNLDPTSSHGTFRVVNDNGTSQASIFCITLDGAASATIDGTLTGTNFWLMVGGSADQ